MNPNSSNQLWSRWTAIVSVPFAKVLLSPTFETEMRRATATFYRRLFGSATEMKIDAFPSVDGRARFVVDCRTEGRPANDPLFRRQAKKEIANFFGKNLRRHGEVHVRIEVRIEAGDPGDGKPPSQLIVAPPISLT